MGFNWAKCVANACLVQVFLSELHKVGMVAGQVPGFARLPVNFPIFLCVPNIMATGPAFSRAAESIAKATAMNAAMDSVAPAIAERVAKFCFSRAKPVAQGPPRRRPLNRFFFRKFVKSLIINDPHDPFDNDSITNSGAIIIVDNQPVLRLDKEVRFIADKERNKWSDMLDKVIDKFVFTMNGDQRVEAM